MPRPLQNSRSNSLANVPPPLQDNNGAPVTMDPTTGTSQVCVWRDFGYCTEWVLFIPMHKVDGISLLGSFRMEIGHYIKYAFKIRNWSFLPPPSPVATTHQINIMSCLYRQMFCLTEGKSVGITKRGNAEVRTTNFSRFRYKRHLHWLLAILRLTKFCWSTTLLDAFCFVYLQLRLEPSSTGKAMFVM